MDFFEELNECQRQFDRGEISEEEHNERRKLIFTRIADPNKTNPEAVSKPKETDFYTILQLKPSATETEIRKNYRKLALKYHPDKNGNVETEEWGKISKAYKILSDVNSRYLYDNYGTWNDSAENKASFNRYVGGDPWQPYIGNLEVGFWIFSFEDSESSPELKNISKAEQKSSRHAARISNITRYLQDKLIQFPKQNDPSFEGSLRREALNLCAEPNGKELLSLLSEIYISKAQSYLNKCFVSATSIKYSGFFNILRFTKGLVSGFLTVKSKSGQQLNEDEVTKLIWQFSLSEISSVAYETCEKVLNDKSNDLDHLANSLLLLGKVWLE
ncbi:610_t:CDS:2, partial [Acaulospora morrowiae]